jgi:hypothetical protein
MLKTPPSHPNTIGWATAIGLTVCRQLQMVRLGRYLSIPPECTQNVLCEIYDIVGHVVELLLVVGKPSTPPPPPVPRPGPGRLLVQTNVKTPSRLSPAFEFPKNNVF